MMKNIMKTNQREQSGQSLVELAISLIVILFLLLGAVEFSLALFQYVTIRDAAQEGVVYGSINPAVDSAQEAQIKARALDAASDVLGGQLTEADISVFINGDPAATAPSNQKCEGLTGGTPNHIRVDITFAHPITLPMVTNMIGTNTINLKASVTNTILSPACPLP
jgi:Flp pilus assembly protein TadG